MTILHEISGRAKLAASMKDSAYHPGIAREMCYLQLRHICELLAMGCLGLTADAELFARFNKTYEPRLIFNELERRNPHFYPEAVSLIRDSEVFRIETKSKAVLSQQRLHRLWGLSGVYLHRLSIKRFLHDETDGYYELVEAHLEHIRELIDDHWIYLNPERTSGLLVSLSSPNGRPQATVYDFYDEGRSNAIHYRFQDNSWNVIGMPHQRQWEHVQTDTVNV